MNDPFVRSVDADAMAARKLARIVQVAEDTLLREAASFRETYPFSGDLRKQIALVRTGLQQSDHSWQGAIVNEVVQYINVRRIVVSIWPELKGRRKS